MGAERLPMRQIFEILRLKHESRLSCRAIARACGVGVGTVSEYLRRAQRAGLAWPLPPELDEAALEARLFAPAETGREQVPPDLVRIHQELKRPGVTLHLLWEEYREVHADGYGYSQYCEIYRRWAGKLKPSMRQHHRAGEKTFIDFSGKRPHLVDRRTGEEIPVELFVAALGASSYTYAEATPTQKLHDWVGAHTRMLEYFGGCTQLWVPDQLKSAITQPCRYEPGVNRSYQDLAAHYGAVVVPARPGKARDKAKVESMVLVAQRWILARLRHRTFFELAELNAAICDLLERLNGRPMQKLRVSRRELWEQLDRPALKPLPVTRYDLAQWKPCRVNIDYHVEVDHHPYSVPYQLVHESVEVRFTASVVEVYYKGRRVASHARRYDRQPSTLAEHMPSSHRAHAEWTPSRLIHWAEKTGPATGRLVAGILESRPHPEQGYRACLGLMRLGRHYGSERLEAASARAERLRSYSYRTVKNILASAQDHLPFEDEPSAPDPTPLHANIRGADYYAAPEENEC
jgi:transposase